MKQGSATHPTPSRYYSEPVRSRRANRLDNALEDARAISALSLAMSSWAVQRQTEGGRPENVAANQVHAVYDRVEQRNSASTPMCARTSSLSEAQVESAEQAVIMFVAKMHKVASNEDAQAKESMVRALINDTVALRVSLGSTVTPVSIKQNQTDVQPDDIASWYVVGKEIGRGTFGRVRRATHRLSGTVVAIKSYARLRAARSCLAVGAVEKRVVGDSAGDALEWRRVRQEVNVLSRLRPHPNVMRFVEVFETPTRMHVVTELVRGTSLLDVLRRAPGQRLTETRAKRIFCQLTAAVEALHSQRVIHRDLKLENILLDERSGHASIIDFGFSDFEDTDDRQTEEDGGSKKQIKKKNFCGTPSYMAPEVVTSECYDGRPVDVWSLGVLLYVMLCGKFPFQGASFHHLYQKLRSGTQQLALPPTLSAGARSVLQAALTVDPVKRPCAGDLRSYQWLQEVENPKTTLLHRRNTLVSAFEEWAGTTQAVCTALAELYGLQLNPTDLEETSEFSARRCSHLGAFVVIATLVSGQYFQKAVTHVSSAEPSPPRRDNQQQQESESAIHSNSIQISHDSFTSRHKQNWRILSA